MEEYILKEVRAEYNTIKKENETLILYKNELLTLANDEKVKRFLELRELVDEDYVGPSEETMIMRAYQGVPDAFGEQAINSNHIMIFMGSYIKGEQNYDYMTYERNPDTSYRLYMDLETAEYYKVDKDKCLEFESEYLTLYLPVSEYTEREYHRKYIELQKRFKKQLMHRSQQHVIRGLQKKYEKKCKKLNFYFQKIDTIANIPIETYVKMYPTDGFNYCLSKEETMRVKLYRKQKKL